MRPGRTPIAPTEAALRGTRRADRHATRAEAYTPTDPPVQPEQMTDAARAVWDDEVTRAIAAGACEFDSSLFASYCELTAAIRQGWTAGEGPIPPAAHLSEHRKMAELFGLAGRRSRVGTAPPGSGNAFARNGASQAPRRRAGSGGAPKV